MQINVMCDCCGSIVTPDSEHHRGMLANQIASTSADLINSQELLEVLRSKRIEKLNAKDREIHFRAVGTLEARVPFLEAALVAMRDLRRALYNE